MGQLPNPDMAIDPRRTALVITDPQNDFLSPDGVTWELVGQNVTDNGTVQNIENLLKAAKETGMPVFVSPHYYYPHDHSWEFEGALEKVMHNINMFDRKDPLSLEGFEGSGPDWLERYKPYIQDGETVVCSPHKVYGPQNNDLVLQLRKRSIDKVILAGMSANLCVEAHLRHLLEVGFEVAVVLDATAAAVVEEGNGYEAAVTNFRFLANTSWTTAQAVEAITGSALPAEAATDNGSALPAEAASDTGGALQAKEPVATGLGSKLFSYYAKAFALGLAATLTIQTPAIEAATATQSQSARLVGATELVDGTVSYGTVDIDGLDIFYREAGSRENPTILLLHGFPTSSHMFRNLMPALAADYHVIAPDYPGYGYSSMPSVDEFDYTFDRFAEIIEAFTERLDLGSYSIYLQDYGAPVGYRLAASHPERVEALIVQNGNAYDEGLLEFWNPLKAFWADRSQANAEPLLGFLTLETTKWQYLHGVRDSSKISPDTWSHVQPLLDRPGNNGIQLAMFYSYGSNPPLYPEWQEYFRQYQPPTLIVWGQNDYIFPAEGAHPYKRDLETLEFHLLDTGHFALEERGAEIAEWIRTFLDIHVKKAS